MKEYIIKRKKLAIPLLFLLIGVLISLPLIQYKKIQDATPFDIVVANITTSSVDIYWKTKGSDIQLLSYKEKNSTVPYREVNNSRHLNDVSTHSNLYVQTIEDLLPEKTYVFRIRSKNNTVEKEVDFKTAKVDNTLTFPTIEAGEGPKETLVLISIEGENLMVDTQDHGTWAFDSKGREFSTSNYATYATEKSLGDKLRDLLKVKNAYLLATYADEGGNWWEEAPNCNIYQDNDIPTVNQGFSKDDVRNLMNQARYSSCGESHYGEICYGDIICRSVEKRVDPGVVFSIWYQETQGSNFQGYHASFPNGAMPWHFGINDKTVPSFSEQLDRLLINLKEKKNSYASAETMVDFALISSGVDFNDKVKIFISQIRYLAGTAPDGVARQTGFDDPFLNNFKDKTETVKEALSEAIKTLEGAFSVPQCKNFTEEILANENTSSSFPRCQKKEEIRTAIETYKKASRYLMYLRANYSEEESSVENFNSFTTDTKLGAKTCTLDRGGELTFSNLTKAKTRKQCVEALACIADKNENFFDYNTYAYNIALNYCQLTGKNFFELKYPPTLAISSQNTKCKNPTVNTKVLDCQGGGTSGSMSGGSSGSSSGGNKIVGNSGNRPPTAPIKQQTTNSNDPNNDPDRDEMVVNNETRYCTNKNGCICIYNYQTSNEKKIDIKDGQKCTPNQEVQETKKVCCQFPNKGLYTVDEYNCTEENIVRNDRSGSTCDSKTISYNFKPGYNIIQMQEIHNKTDVPLTTAKTFIDISEKSVITISKFANNRWGETVILKDGNIHGADFDIKQGEVYLVTSKNNLRLDTLGIKVIPSSNIPTAQGWSLIPTNDLQTGLTTHQIYKVDKYKNIEQVALLDNIRNSFIYTIKDEKGELIGEDISLSNYDAIFLKLKEKNL